MTAMLALRRLAYTYMYNYNDQSSSDINTEHTHKRIIFYVHLG